MERKRSSSSEEDSSDLKNCRQKFTEVESIVKDDTDKYFDEPLSHEYQPQFFNYQLMGDLVAVGILNSTNLIIKRTYYEPVEPITRRRFCDEAWSVQDLLLEMKSQKSRYPIAKKVMLSVGYNDCRSNLMNVDMFVECLEKTIKKLRRRGCKEIILTNVPPCGMECDCINHWKYLQIINEEIFKLSSKHDYIEHCDIFKLFCRPKNLFSQNKDYVSGSEINYKVDFTMYNEVGRDDEIDLISFSNVAKIVLGKHVAKTVEKRVEYLRHGQVDKVICVLKEASDVDDSDSEDEAVVIMETDNAAVINLDDSDENDAGGNCQDDAYIQKEILPQANVPVRQEISTCIKKQDNINEERPSCEMPPENQRMKQLISNSNESVDDIKNERPSCEMPPEEERMKQVILCSIKIVDGIKNEKTCELPQEEDRMKQVISSSIKSVGVMRSEEPSCQMLNVSLNQVISCSIRSVSDTEDEKLCCEMPAKNEKIKQEIVGDIEESVRIRREIVRNMEISKLIKQESVSNTEKSEPVTQEIVCKIEKSDPIKEEIVSNKKSEPIEQEVVSSVEIPEPVKQEIVRNIERSDNM